jgi:hypothetical protein
LIDYGDIALAPSNAPISPTTPYLARATGQSLGTRNDPTNLSYSVSIKTDPGLYDMVIRPSSVTHFPWILLPATLVPQEQNLPLGTLQPTAPVQISGVVMGSSGPLATGRVQAFGLFTVGSSSYRLLVAEAPVASDGTYDMSLPSAYESIVRVDHSQAIGVAMSGFAWAAVGNDPPNYVPPGNVSSACTGGSACTESAWTTSQDGVCVSTCVPEGVPGCDSQIQIGVDASSQQKGAISGSYQTLSVNYSGAPAGQSMTLEVQVSSPGGSTTYCNTNYVSATPLRASDFVTPCNGTATSQQPLASFSGVQNVSLLVDTDSPLKLLLDNFCLAAIVWGN